MPQTLPNPKVLPYPQWAQAPVSKKMVYARAHTCTHMHARTPATSHKFHICGFKQAVMEILRKGCPLQGIPATFLLCHRGNDTICQRLQCVHADNVAGVEVSRVLRGRAGFP